MKQFEDQHYQIHDGVSTTLIFKGYQSVPSVDGSFIVGWVTKHPELGWEVLIQKPSRAYESETKEVVAIVDSKQAAIELLWNKRVDLIWATRIP